MQSGSLNKEGVLHASYETLLKTCLKGYSNIHRGQKQGNHINMYEN